VYIWRVTMVYDNASIPNKQVIKRMGIARNTDENYEACLSGL